MDNILFWIGFEDVLDTRLLVDSIRKNVNMFDDVFHALENRGLLLEEVDDRFLAFKKRMSWESELAVVSEALWNRHLRVELVVQEVEVLEP